jgi:hypothetical protein
MFYVEINHITQVAEAAQLQYARGKVGERNKLRTPEAKAEFARQLGEHQRPVTKRNTADCGDDRLTIALANGTRDASMLRSRIVPQLFGGAGLAATKAAIAANAVIIRDAKNVTEAYHTISAFLLKQGEEDGGHEGCGASGSVETSVANVLPFEFVENATGLFVAMNERRVKLLAKNAGTKHKRLEAGFYNGWVAGNHEDYLSERFPQNFSFLADDPNDHETNGHNGSGILAIGRDEFGFAKNEFILATSAEAFAVTPWKMRHLAGLIGTNDDEIERITLGFLDDTLHVGAGIVVPGMPIFADV